VSATFTKVPNSEDVIGTRHRQIAYDVLLDSSYPDNNSSTFGYKVSPQLVGVTNLNQIESVTFSDRTVPPSGYSFAWDPTHGTIRVLRVAGLLINAVNDSGSPTLSLGELSGALSTNGGTTGITGIQPAVLARVTDGVSLSTVTVRATFKVTP
jgi:hypothetical protein